MCSSGSFTVTTVEPACSERSYTAVSWSGCPPNKLDQKPGSRGVGWISSVALASLWTVTALGGTPALCSSATAASAWAAVSYTARTVSSVIGLS